MTLQNLNDLWDPITKRRVLVVGLTLSFYFTVAGYVPILAWLLIAALATGFMMWMIIFKLRRLIISPAYQFMFAGKAVAFILCIAAVYLVIRPLPHRIELVSRLWFSSLALSYILMVIGHYLYSKDLAAVLGSRSYSEPLPAVPPTPEQQELDKQGKAKDLSDAGEKDT